MHKRQRQKYALRSFTCKADGLSKEEKKTFAKQIADLIMCPIMVHA
jgi:hypothetical protein